MRVLFAIFVLAFAGLVWATIAAAQHIRRARRRQRTASKELAVQNERLSVSRPAIVHKPTSSPEGATSRLIRPKPVQSYF